MVRGRILQASSHLVSGVSDFVLIEMHYKMYPSFCRKYGVTMTRRSCGLVFTTVRKAHRDIFFYVCGTATLKVSASKHTLRKSATFQEQINFVQSVSKDFGCARLGPLTVTVAFRRAPLTRRTFLNERTAACERYPGFSHRGKDTSRTSPCKIICGRRLGFLFMR